jgi:hypothetical protein
MGDSSEVPETSFAFIVHCDGTHTLLIPSGYEDSGKPLPRPAAYMVAIALRSSDEKFVDEMIGWLNAEADKAN